MGVFSLVHFYEPQSNCKPGCLDAMYTHVQQHLRYPAQTAGTLAACTTMASTGGALQPA